MVDTFGTGTVDNSIIEDAVCSVFDLRPGAIIEKLNLRNTSYAPVAAYGHFGRRDLDLPWERLDMVQALKEEL